MQFAALWPTSLAASRKALSRAPAEAIPFPTMSKAVDVEGRAMGWGSEDRIEPGRDSDAAVETAQLRRDLTLVVEHRHVAIIITRKCLRIDRIGWESALARVAFRTALDRSEHSERLACLDIVPPHHVVTSVMPGRALASYPIISLESYHWFFLAQKAPYPERLICADLDYYIRYKLNKQGVCLEIFSPAAMAEHIRCTTPNRFIPCARTTAPRLPWIWP
jgi:hypothetical protein